MVSITERNEREASLKVPMSALWFLAQWWRGVFCGPLVGCRSSLSLFMNSASSYRAHLPLEHLPIKFFFLLPLTAWVLQVSLGGSHRGPSALWWLLLGQRI